MTLQELNNMYGNNLQLVLDSQDINEILEQVGINEDYFADITGIVEILDNGEVVEVWLTESNAPYLNTSDYDIPDFWVD